MRAGTRVGIAVVLTAVAAAGCTTQDPGTASPNTSSGSATTPSVSIPPRPKTINNAAGVDPCTLLTDSQVAELKAKAGKPGAGEPASGTTSSCSYQVTDPVGYTVSVRVEPKRGIDYWLTYTGTWQDRQITVSSYPSVQIISKGEDWNGPTGTLCRTLVSIADGQELSAGVLPYEKNLSMTQMCDLSKQVAGLALATLQAKS